MPGLDKTGPLGQGALTGRRTSRCNPDAETESGGFFPRRRFAGRATNENSRITPGGGRGPGRGFGRIWGKNRGRQA